MPDFDPPFADEGERRLPTSTEQALGFPCGPGSRELFNGLFWLLQGQIRGIADEAGVVPSQEGDITLLTRAVLALIDAATGGNPEGYILMSQARTRLPIFPHMLHADGHLAVLSPSTGTVRVPAGRSFLHRGIFSITTAETDFATDPSKTYHLRWTPADGFVLRDLASGTYNSTALAESNPTFDSTFDDMLVARVVTNSSNVATVTNLINRDRLMTTQGIEATNFQAPNTNVSRGDIICTLNWARTPQSRSWSYVQRSQAGTTAGQTDFDEFMFELGGYPGVGVSNIPGDRYRIAFTMVVDFTASFRLAITAGA